MGSAQETNRLQQRTDPFLSRRMTRRTALVGGATFTLGAAAAAIGCGGGTEEINPTGTASDPSQLTLERSSQTSEQTKETEKLSDELEFIPFEILDHFPWNPEVFSSVPTPEEGFRFVIIKTGIKNISNKPLSLSDNIVDPVNNLFGELTLITSQGHEYKMDVEHSDYLRTNRLFQVPPGFSVKYIYPYGVANQGPEDENYGPSFEAEFLQNDSYRGEKNSMVNFVFQVPQKASGLTLNIPGYDAINLDQSQTIKGFDNSRNFDDIIGAEVPVSSDKVKVTVRDFAPLSDPKSVLHIPSWFYTPGYFGEGLPALIDQYKFYALNLTFANQDQGYAQDGFITLYAISKSGVLYSVDFREGSTIGFTQIGPSISKDHTLYLAYPKEETDIKFILIGTDLKIYNTPIT